LTACAGIWQIMAINLMIHKRKFYLKWRFLIVSVALLGAPAISWLSYPTARGMVCHEPGTLIFLISKFIDSYAAYILLQALTLPLPMPGALIANSVSACPLSDVCLIPLQNRKIGNLQAQSGLKETRNPFAKSFRSCFFLYFYPTILGAQDCSRLAPLGSPP
jgi:hypothetical protein